MILVDMNQVTISNLMMQIGSKRQNDVDGDMVRHMVLSSLRLYRNKFLKQYGELVICCDDKDYWRKHRFPHYKASRKKDREQSTIDWNVSFRSWGRTVVPISRGRYFSTHRNSLDIVSP